MMFLGDFNFNNNIFEFSYFNRPHTWTQTIFEILPAFKICIAIVISALLVSTMEAC